MKCMKQGMKPATKITQVSVPGRYGGVATPSIIHVPYYSVQVLHEAEKMSLAPHIARNELILFSTVLRAATLNR
jgi:hypothetical protein